MRDLYIGGIPTSLGEVCNIRYHLDAIKSNYDKITLGFNTKLWDECLHTEAPDWKEKEILWHQYLADIGKLLFSEPPYVLEENPAKYGGDIGVLAQKLNIQPQKAELGQFLCKGTSLNLGEEYIVITTKVRHGNRKLFIPLSIQLWDTLNSLSNKYKIVILGERKTEMRKEYGDDKNVVFSLYEDIICNLPKERILDLTVPALGETPPDMKQVCQDCLIMKESKFCLTIGVGGNFCLSTSVANMAIGFRMDNLEFTDKIYEGKTYFNAVITKNWNVFIEKLRNI